MGKYRLFQLSQRIAHTKLKHPDSFTIQGGYQSFLPSAIPALLDATATFSATNTDPKAQIILTLSYLAGLETPILLSFYDGPTPGASLAPFQRIPGSVLKDVSTRSFSSLAKAPPTITSSGQRGAFHTLSTKGYTRGFLEAVRNETKFYNALAAAHTGTFISYDIEPFLPTYGSKAVPDADSAFPHTSSPLPLNLDFNWLSPAEDTFWRTKMQQSVDYLTAVAKREGIYDASLTAYPNYALSTYTGDQLFGPTNAARLRNIKAAVDPQGVMDLTGGFKI